jgi:manganese transport protein
MNIDPSALAQLSGRASDVPLHPRELDTSPRAPRRRWWSFLGAGSLIAVGYMDPGNWATALAGGARYGYRLLFVILIASLMGMLLQWVASRVGLVTGRDLAQLCRERFSRGTTLGLWVACEIAIIACDVAEVVGSAVALQMLLGISLTAGVLCSAVGTFVMLALQSRGKRPLQCAITALILFVGLCFVVELALAHPDWADALRGFTPPPALLRDAGMLWLAAGILGATVMPHNLYLHSALVKNHAPNHVDAAIGRALKGVNIDTFASLGLAHLITHKSFAEFSGVLEAGGEIRHSLQALPDGFDSGFAVAFARQEAAEHGDQAHDLIQTR